MVNIAVLVSGGGTNLQAIIDALEAGKIKNARICAVVSSSSKAYALERAKTHGIPAFTVRRRDHASADEFCDAIDECISPFSPGLIVLAGFLSILTEKFCSKYENRIINIHPSLIPDFCGDGFYGLRVHEAVLEAGVPVTGATVHFVSAVTDGGPIIMQKKVNVEPGDTPEILQKRVMAQAEHQILPQVVSLFCEGKIKVIDGKAVIEE